ncbi:MAG TPA: hypothetical protein PLI95_18170 [Polyangiaceae bacterium]|nr:hypothetical protein [Polyangiaceae bacterium]
MGSTRDAIRENMSRRGSAELRTMLAKKDLDTYSEEAFEVAREILKDRNDGKVKDPDSPEPASKQVDSDQPGGKPQRVSAPTASSSTREGSRDYANLRTVASACGTTGNGLQIVAVALGLVFLVCAAMAFTTHWGGYDSDRMRGSLFVIGSAASALAAPLFYWAGIMTKAVGEAMLALADIARNTAQKP